MSTVNEYTIQSWIRAFRNEPNLVSALMLKWGITDRDTAVFFMDETILSKYYPEIEPYRRSRMFTPRETHFYGYNPRLYAYDLYGMPELWYLVLYANEMHSAMEFHDIKKIKFYDRSVLPILNAIMLKERGILDENEAMLSDLIVNNRVTNQDVNIQVV